MRGAVFIKDIPYNEKMKERGFYPLSKEMIIMAFFDFFGKDEEGRIKEIDEGGRTILEGIAQGLIESWDEMKKANKQVLRVRVGEDEIFSIIDKHLFERLLHVGAMDAITIVLALEQAYPLMDKRPIDIMELFENGHSIE